MTATPDALVLARMLAGREVAPTPRRFSDLIVCLDRLENTPQVIEAITRTREVERNAPHCSTRELEWLRDAVERCFDDLTPSLGLTGAAS